MKILAVRFKNLNSLAGEWYVDFTHPAYTGDGIFAITGPTGSGKTTILDAICLGLYGRTPRLEKVTKSGNEIMSRQTGECFAEVTFETQKGRFRCHWSQRRARKHHDGELQQPKHEIVNGDTGAVLESKIAQVGERVVDVTGMDFDRFTRSMLLAQGGFTAFLQASADERAPILEEITGTEIYSRISVNVHERRNEEREKLSLLEAESKGIQLLNEEDKERFRAALEEKKSLETNLAGRVEALRKAGLWLEAVASLEKELTGLEERRQDLETRRQAFATDGHRLAKAMKALDLEGDYREIEVLRVRQATDSKELEDATVALPLKERAIADAMAAKEVVENAVRETKRQQQGEGEVIRKVRDLDVQLAGQKKSITEKDEATRVMEKEITTHRERLTDFEDFLEKRQAELAAIVAYQTEHTVDAGLVTNLNAISRIIALLRDLEARGERMGEELVEADARRAAALKARDKIETDHEKLRNEFEEKQRESVALAVEITSVLKGREMGEWREETETLKARERVLVQGVEIVGRMAKADKDLEALREALKRLTAGQERTTVEIEDISERRKIAEADVAHLEVQVSLLGRIRDLEEERKRLEDGSPCPLCGAVDHPYARGNIPHLDEGEKFLKRARADLKKLMEALGKSEKEHVRTYAEIGHVEKEIAEKKSARDEDEEQLHALLEGLSIEVRPEEYLARMNGALAHVQGLVAYDTGVLAAAAEKERRAKVIQSALHETSDRLDRLGKALNEARLQSENARLTLESLTRESKTLALERTKAVDVLRRDVAPFQVQEASLADPKFLLVDLTLRKERWLAKEQEKAAGERRMNEATAGIDRERALLEKLEADLAANRAGRQRLEREHGVLQGTRRELFGQKDTETEEKRLARAVDRAEASLEAAREALGHVVTEVAALREHVLALQKKTEEGAVLLARMEQAMMERIRQAGFEDEEEYLAFRLSAEDRERLAAQEKALTKEWMEIETRRNDRTEVLTMERERCLTNKPIEEIRGELADGEGELKQVRQDMGAIASTLEEDERLLDKQRERLVRIDAQKKECSRWDELHQLIGSADGKKYRNFAQGLTFGIMVAHANRQLLKMTDRYLLVRDSDQPLELNVIDNYQAGEIRSTKNLSGGECFIVSLALALGLSHMASRNVRVDSLFLDEGFGTLDEDALETALETLAGLHQDGKLIGLISHVAALKERIATRIEIVPKRGGCSVIQGPGCTSL